MGKNTYIAMYLTELQTALNDIEDFTRDQTQETFVKNRLCHKAVAKSFEQIGEASNKIKKTAPEFVEKHATIAWSDMYKFRNVLVHDYMGVDPERTWEIIRTYLPTLKENITNLLQQEPKIKELVNIGVQAYNATWSSKIQTKPKRMKM